MAFEYNPFTPGAGRIPAYLAGRENILHLFDHLIEGTSHGYTDRAPMIHGLRGTGKTILLTKFAHLAQEQGWIVVKYEAGGLSDKYQQLQQDITHAIKKFIRQHHKIRYPLESLIKTLSSFACSATVFGVSLQYKVTTFDINEISFAELVEEAVPILREQKLGFLLAIDEVQDFNSDILTYLLQLSHKAQQEQWPFFFTCAGLSSAPGILTQARSYAERLFQYQEIGALKQDESADVIAKPFEQYGKSLTPDALAYIVREAEGYPYFLQEFGNKLWDEIIGNEAQLEDAQHAVQSAYTELDKGFFRSRWSRTTTAEKEYLAVLAISEQNSLRTAEIAHILNRKPADLTTVRQKLIDKGIIWASGHGEVSFTTPGMHKFIQRYTL